MRQNKYFYQKFLIRFEKLKLSMDSSNFKKRNQKMMSLNLINYEKKWLIKLEIDLIPK